MTDYILEHHQRGERDRLALMAQLFDPMHRRSLELLGIGPGAEALEVGCGNGSIAAWLGERTAPGGRVVAVDIDLSLTDPETPNVEFRKGDILAGPVEPAGFDLVTARAVLHHLPDDGGAARAAARVRGVRSPPDRRLPGAVRRPLVVDADGRDDRRLRPRHAVIGARTA